MAKKRNEFSEEEKWSLTDLYPSDFDFEQELITLKESLPAYQKYKNHLLEDAQTLYQFLLFDREYAQKLERAYIYANLKKDQDTTDTKAQTLYGKIMKLYEEYSEQTSFVTPEILKGSYSLIQDFLVQKPELKEFERMVKEIFRFQAHTLSEKEETLLSSLSSSYNAPEEIYSSLNDADLKFGLIQNEQGKKEEFNEVLYRKLLESANPSIRKKAFSKLLTTYGNFKNTYASLLSNEVQNNNKIAKIKGYESALDAALYQNNIPKNVYLHLIETVKKNIEPLSKYWKLKSNILGIPLHLYDAFAPIVKEDKKEYSLKEAEELLLNSLSVLGPTYISDLEKAFQEKWIDFCPNKGKRGGAYCVHCYSTHPYVLLNYAGNFDSVSTLAHELGHAMHSYYAMKNQTFQDYEYSIFVAEVASQVNQILLSKYLIAHTKEKTIKMNLIDELIKDFKSTVYRQTMFADFELQIHEKDWHGEVLTNEVFCTTYYKLNQEYFGKNIIVDKKIQYEWARIPHFYMNYYVYQYATAYVAAIKISLDILKKKDHALENYLEFLKLGDTLDPIESLKVAGVDMLEETPYNEAFAYFKELIEELICLVEE